MDQSDKARTLLCYVAEEEIADWLARTILQTHILEAFYEWMGTDGARKWRIRRAKYGSLQDWSDRSGRYTIRELHDEIGELHTWLTNRMARSGLHYAPAQWRGFVVLAIRNYEARSKRRRT